MGTYDMTWEDEKKIIEGIGGIFEDAVDIKVDAAEATVTFETKSNTATFDKLLQLSMLLRTRDINFTGREEDISTGVTRNGREWSEITCRDIRF